LDIPGWLLSQNRPVENIWNTKGQEVKTMPAHGWNYAMLLKGCYIAAIWKSEALKILYQHPFAKLQPHVFDC
jgi:hypothetical protein